MCARCHVHYDGTNICLRRGEDVAGAKLTPAQVLEIRALHHAGATQRQLAGRFGVAPTTIYNIVGRQTTWRWLTGETFGGATHIYGLGRARHDDHEPRSGY